MPPNPLRISHEEASASSDETSSFHVINLDDSSNSKSQIESLEFLHLLVEDLRHEVEVLRTQREESEQECSILKAKLQNMLEGDKQQIKLLVETLSRVSHSKTIMTQEQMNALSAEEASNLTIATLSRKVEELSIKNTTLMEEKIFLAERVQELEGENEAKQIKIDALELQFKAINKTRQKVVGRLINKDHANSSAKDIFAQSKWTNSY